MGRPEDRPRDGLSRRSFLVCAVGITGGLLQACRSGASIAPAVSSPSSSQRASSAAAWQAVVDAAKKEGSVVVYGLASDATHDALVDGFQATYGINVDYTGASGRDVATKIETERAAGLYGADVIVSGTQTLLHDLKPAGALIGLTPLLSGPDDSDPSQWKNGAYSFADDTGDYDLMFSGRVQLAFVYNPNLMDASAITSWNDLLDPRWKGKMAMLNPTIGGGASQELTTYFYTQATLGKPFLQKLFQQDVQILSDSRQLLDLVGQGSLPLAIGPDGVLAYSLHQQGVPINLFSSASLQEGGYLSAGNGTLALFDTPPHPNAQELYANYLLSQPGQLAWSKQSSLASFRRDVPTDFLPPDVVPQEGVSYVLISRESYQLMSDEVAAYVKSVMPS